MNIRETVIDTMRERGITQQQLADRTGITQPALSRWLCGHMTMNERKIEAVLKALGLTISSERATTMPEPGRWGSGGPDDNWNKPAKKPENTKAPK